MPQNTIIRVLEMIEPTFMQHILSLMHIKKLLNVNDDCIISIFINFIKQSQWKLYPADDSEIKFSKKLFPKPKKIKRILNYLIKKCMSWSPETGKKLHYAKIDIESLKAMSEITVNHVVQTIYITLEAYLDAYDVQCVQETWNKLNEQLLDDGVTQNQEALLEHSSYAVTEHFIKKYRSILKTTSELVVVFNNLRCSGEMPEVLNIFKNIGLLQI